MQNLLLQSLLTVCVFFSLAFADSTPIDGTNSERLVIVTEVFTNTVTVCPCATTSSCTNTGLFVSPTPSVITTVIVYTTTTVCPVTLTHTSGGSTSIEVSSSTSTVVITTTQTIGLNSSSSSVSTGSSASSVVYSSLSTSSVVASGRSSLSSAIYSVSSPIVSSQSGVSTLTSGYSSSIVQSTSSVLSSSTYTAVSSQSLQSESSQVSSSLSQSTSSTLNSQTSASYQSTSSNLGPSSSQTTSSTLSQTSASYQSTSSNLGSSSSQTTSSTVSSVSSVPLSSSASSQSTQSSSTSLSVTTGSSKTSSSLSSTTQSSTTSSASPTATGCYYWLEDIEYQGVAPFSGDGSYQVFRNVKDPAYGAKGDGVTDDTAAINAAIASGSNCPPGGACQSTTTTPAIIYFPPGTYVVSAPILQYYLTSLVGNPNCLPVIKATNAFTTANAWVIDADKYGGNGLGYGGTNVFWRQIRNFVIDMTDVPSDQNVFALHWPTAQATSVQNVVFKMSDAPGTQHQGLFSEKGSGGFMTDLTFYGGLNGLSIDNQQFAMRNLTFYNAVNAINHGFDWGWVYKGISVYNCSVAVNMGVTGVASMTIIDSYIQDTPIGVLMARDTTSATPAAGSLILENVKFTRVSTALVQGPSGAVLAGTTGTVTVAAWGQGDEYTPNGPTTFQGPITPNTRPGELTAGGKYYERSKPQYETYLAASFISVRYFGARGDGVTDDSDALNYALYASSVYGYILFFDAGDYLVSKTLYIPAGSKIIGEAYPVILASGALFEDMDNPAPVIQVGKPGETGTIQWSDMIISTKGAQQGAILIEWNLDSTGFEPAGMWDVHTRIGGFTGSDLQVANCSTGPFDSRNQNTTVTSANLPQQCIAAFLSMHISKSATNLYMENVWLWVADHDADDASVTQISVYAGRGLLVESTEGVIWMYGTAVEHHSLYQYQFANTKKVFMGQIQTETPYYQPNPNTAIPFPAVSSLNDPAVAASALGLRVLGSEEILIYSAGLYSFFYNYNVHCSDQGNGEWCQPRIFSVESSGVSLYNLNTVGTQNMIELDGTDIASYTDNIAGFIDTIALFRS